MPQEKKAEQVSSILDGTPVSEVLTGAGRKRRVTLADIAKLDGTHVTTVSLALRNSQRLPEKTRLRIQRLAKKMGYTPDPMMRALVSYRESTRTRINPQVIAYITNWTTRWGWRNVTAHPEFYEGARAAAEEMGYILEHFWMREPGLTHGRLSRILDTRGINGVIIASHVRDIDEHLRFDWEHFSAVKIDFFPHKPELHNVTNNQSGIVRLAMRRVMRAGYRRIGFVMHRGWDHSVDRLWSAGFLVEQAWLPEPERIPMCLFPEAEPEHLWINQGKGEVEPRPELFEDWYERWKPEVIISRGAFVLPRLEKMGLKIPEDVAFVDVFNEDNDGEIAGVRQNHEAVGAIAVQTLAGQLTQNRRGVPKIPTTTFVDGTWIDGASLPVREEALALQLS